MPISGRERVRPLRASVDAMLGFAWNADVFVATDAMAATGLTRSTSIEAMDELIDLGLLRELPNARAAGEYSKGRPSRRFVLRADAAVLVGMDAGRANITTKIADLRGVELVRKVTELTPAQDTRDGRRAAVLDAMDSALRELERGRESVLAACIGVPAPVNAEGDSPLQREGFWQLMNPDLRGLLTPWVPIVRIENDASLAAVAEGSVGMAAGMRDFVVLLAGARLGAGVVTGGHLLRGHHGGAGEMRAFANVRGVGSADGIGLRLSEWAREELAAGAVPPETVTRLSGEAITGRAVLRLARSGDVWAQRLVGRAGALLARITTVFSSLYDPARVIVAGAVAEDLDEVLASALTHLSREDELPPPELVGSRLGADAVVTGAVSGAREAARQGVLHLGAAELGRLLDSGDRAP
ncbi:MAG: ROK family protein [Propionibacteriaceae bacterium]|nr:ROK family protein [Propionibacteriaceae bacterium]